jgi:hypothetical protein
LLAYCDRVAAWVQFGALGAVEIIRRNAHEVHHHLMDINRYRDRQPRRPVAPMITSV